MKYLPPNKYDRPLKAKNNPVVFLNMNCEKCKKKARAILGGELLCEDHAKPPTPKERETRLAKTLKSRMIKEVKKC